jgi:hypothetical protein
MRKIYFDLTGQTFGRLTALKVEHRDGGRLVWKCLCICGGETYTFSWKLRTGKATSCGCYRKEVAIQNFKVNIIHGMTKTRFHKIWTGMLERCSNKNHSSYTFYGKRGIVVCESWLKFMNFRDDMYQSYLEHITSYSKKKYYFRENRR